MKRMKNGGVGVLSMGFVLSAAALSQGLFGERAQGQGAVMVTKSDDGSGGEMTFISTGPDLFALKQPDFVRTDIPVMRDKLRLDTMQEQMIRTMVDEYLIAFKKLIDEKFPKQMPGMFMFGTGDEGNFGDDDQPGFGGFDLGDLGDGDVEGAGTTVMIGVNSDVTEGGDGQGGGDGGVNSNVGVQIQVAGPEGKELTPEQRKALEEQAKKVAEAVKAKIEKQLEEQKKSAGSDPEPHGPEEIQARMDKMTKEAEAFSKDKAKLRAQFVQDAQSRISPGQVDLWPGLERALLRKKSLPNGRLDGEQTDLFKVVNTVQVPTEKKAEVDRELSDYEMQLNDAIIRRNDAVDQAEKKISEALKKNDLDKASAIADRASTSREALRDLNIRFADELATTMGGEAGSAFAKAAQRAFHPRIYGMTRAQRAFDKAAKLDGLTDEQKSRMASMREQYEAELAVMNEEIRQTTIVHEGEEIRRPYEQMKKEMQGDHSEQDMGRDVGPIKRAYERRTELDERTMKTLYGMFTEEQVATLPKLPNAKGGNAPVVIYQAGEITGDPVAGSAQPKHDQ
ncbi:MAG TPA: hypothetical protein VG711_03135 [Phycisphaerales bacterium]|nr:hypothetical protein [Phycisphaerales bacterium]